MAATHQQQHPAAEEPKPLLGFDTSVVCGEHTSRWLLCTVDGQCYVASAADMCADRQGKAASVVCGPGQLLAQRVG